MGSDERVIEAARQSTTGLANGMDKKDCKLMHYMMRNRHTSPFEMCEVVFKVRLPIFVARQWVRHRTASLNEYSGRYSVLKPEYYVPDWERLKHGGQGKANLQGSEGLISDGAVTRVMDRMEEETKILAENYTHYMDAEGVSKELARLNQPVSTYTQWMWKIDLHNLFHFLCLRLDSHAQYEIRVYAEAIANVIREVFPVAWECFEEYRLFARFFSRTEANKLENVFHLLEEALDGVDRDNNVVFVSVDQDMERREALFEALSILREVI
jgi:thymidylate synthase (FAD)